MSDRLFVKPAMSKPAEGETAVPLKVRKPSGGHLAAAGEYVPRESYWLRRLNDEDVVEAKPATDAAAATKRSS